MAGLSVGVCVECWGDEADIPEEVPVGMLDPEVIVDGALDAADWPTFWSRKIQNSLTVEFQKQYHGWSPILR